MSAIILCAGFGSRLGAISQNTHKALLKVNGVPNIERTIGFLREIGEDDICIITGYKAQDFSYLAEKFGVRLCFNSNYATQNNLASLILGLETINSGFIIDGDVIMLENVLKNSEKSTYYTTLRAAKSNKNEWVVKVQNGQAIGIEICQKQEPSLFGITYLCADDCETLRQEISRTLIKNAEFLYKKEFYYDNIISNLLDKIEMQVLEVPNEVICEIDDLSDLEELNQKLTAFYS